MTGGTGARCREGRRQGVGKRIGRPAVVAVATGGALEVQGGMRQLGVDAFEIGSGRISKGALLVTGMAAKTWGVGKVETGDGLCGWSRQAVRIVAVLAGKGLMFAMHRCDKLFLDAQEVEALRLPLARMAAHAGERGAGMGRVWEEIEAAGMAVAASECGMG